MRLLDLVPGRSDRPHAGWLPSRSPGFIEGVAIATPDPFRSHGNAIRDWVPAACGGARGRRRVQQVDLGLRGRKNDPLCRIRGAFRAGADKLTDRQVERIDAGLEAGDLTWVVTIACSPNKRLRSAFADRDLRASHQPTHTVLKSFHTCPVPEIARLGRRLRSWSKQFLASFTTDRKNEGGSRWQFPHAGAAVNGIIELHRRNARGFRNGPTTARDDPRRGQPTHP